MAEHPRHVNFTIVPADDAQGGEPRTYANFCAIAHTPFDFTLTFCEVMPLSERQMQAAQSENVVKAPVRVKLVVPVQFIPNLIGALQEHWHVFTESYGSGTATQAPGAGTSGPGGSGPLH